MKYLLLILSLVLMGACSVGSGAKEFTQIEIKNVYTDSVSIRAIAPVNDSTVWFAGSNGKIGVIEGATPKLATVRYQDSLLSFRAIAKTSEAVFILSIANPAVLYKIGLNKNEASFIEQVYLEEGEKVFYDAMHFFNDQEGMAIGDPIDGCFSLIITRDGGDTWTKTPCSQLPEVLEGEAFFAASNTNIEIVGNTAWVVSGGKRARVFKSDDKGLSWEVYEAPIVEGGAMTGIYSVAFNDQDQGVIFGGNWDAKEDNKGNKATTTNGGETWKLISDAEGPGYRSCVRFVPNRKGDGLVAVGSPGISYSPDFGDSWVQLSNEGYYAIEFVNDSTAFASGRNRIDKILFK